MCAMRTGGVRISPCGSPRAELANHQVRPTEAGLMGWYGSPILSRAGSLRSGLRSTSTLRILRGCLPGVSRAPKSYGSAILRRGRWVRQTCLATCKRLPQARMSPHPQSWPVRLGPSPGSVRPREGGSVRPLTITHPGQPGRPIPKATGVPTDVHPPTARPAGTGWPHHRNGPGSARRPANRRRSSASGPTSPGCQ